MTGLSILWDNEHLQKDASEPIKRLRTAFDFHPQYGAVPSRQEDIGEVGRSNVVAHLARRLGRAQSLGEGLRQCAKSLYETRPDNGGRGFSVRSGGYW